MARSLHRTTRPDKRPERPHNILRPRTLVPPVVFHQPRSVLLARLRFLGHTLIPRSIARHELLKLLLDGIGIRGILCDVTHVPPLRAQFARALSHSLRREEG